MGLDGTVKVPLTTPALWNPSSTAVITTTGQVSEIRLDGTRVDDGDIGEGHILGWLQIVILTRR